MLEVVFQERFADSLNQRNEFKDVFCFADDLSMGNIENVLSEKRLDSIGKTSLETIQNTKETLNLLIQKCQSQEAIRIWYSNYPNEYCGMCWLIYELKKRMAKLPQIFLILLPNQVESENTIRKYMGWNEVHSKKLHNFLSLQKEAIPAFIDSAAFEWEKLQKENTMLRVCINGTIQSVPENFYDFFIEKEMAKMDDEFYEPALMGNVLGKYQLGIRDTWIAIRMDKMIEEGKLVVIKKGNRRILKKTNASND